MYEIQQTMSAGAEGGI